MLPKQYDIHTSRRFLKITLRRVQVKTEDRVYLVKEHTAGASLEGNDLAPGHIAIRDTSEGRETWYPNTEEEFLRNHSQEALDAVKRAEGQAITVPVEAKNTVLISPKPVTATQMTILSDKVNPLKPSDGAWVAQDIEGSHQLVAAIKRGEDGQILRDQAGNIRVGFPYPVSSKYIQENYNAVARSFAAEN